MIYDKLMCFLFRLTDISLFGNKIVTIFKNLHELLFLEMMFYNKGIATVCVRVDFG